MSGKQPVHFSPEVEKYVASVKQQSEDLVRTKFPAKIVELNTILENDFSTKDLSIFHQEINIPVPDAEAIARGLQNNAINNHDEVPKKRGNKRKLEVDDEVSEVAGTKVLALPTGPVLCNKNLNRLNSIVKPHIRCLVEDANLLKMWITFLIPKIEDGNNFGVSIQEDTLGEIRTVEAEAATFYEQISRYYINRGKIISKIAKFPHIDDYRKLVEEIDEKQFISLRIVLCEVRNHYAALYDLIIKNMEKIIRPRTSNSENLY
jgi:proteasome activator subunit 3 (PA28 gamma)